MWTSVGAVAALYDISCLVDSPYIDKLSRIVFDLEPKITECNSHHEELHLPYVGRLKPLINHFFVPNPVANGTGLSARFNLAHTTSFTTSKKAAVSPERVKTMCTN